MAIHMGQRYDIVINGGGIVGFTLLKLIQKSPQLNRCRVLLIEQSHKPSTFQQPRRIPDSSTNTVSDQSGSSAPNYPIFSNRVSSITLKSKQILDKLGVWGDFERYAKDVKNIKVWNYDYKEKMCFNQIGHGGEKEVMFSVVENNRLSLGLLNNIYKESDGDESIKWSNNLVNFKKSPSTNLIDVTIKDTKNQEEFTVSTPLVLGCDGFNSKVRDLASMRYKEIDLKKIAVVGTIKVETDFMNPSSQNNDIAFQRFSPAKDTVAALLPMNEKYSSFVISAPVSYAKQLMECDDESFINEFNRLLMDSESPDNILLQRLHDLTNMASKTIEGIISRGPLARFTTSYSETGMGLDVDPPRVTFVTPKSRASFPLIFGSTTPRMVTTLGSRSGPLVALLGDASHRVHPLAGQGLNLGIQDASTFVKQLESKSKSGENIFGEKDHGSLAKALRTYEISRQAYIAPMSLGILGMPYLFKFAPPAAITTFDKLTPLKKACVNFANGI